MPDESDADLLTPSELRAIEDEAERLLAQPRARDALAWNLASATYIARIQSRVETLMATITAMRREGCAARGALESIFLGLTADGIPGDKKLADMADLAADVLVTAKQCDHAVVESP